MTSFLEALSWAGFDPKFLVPAPAGRGLRTPAPVYWANDLFLRRAISLAADMAKSGRTPAPRTFRHGHSRAPLSAARRTPTLVVKHGSQFFSIKLRRHRRARRYTLRIHPTDREAILTMPPRGTLAEAKDFAQLHGGWIAARLGRLPKAARFSLAHGSVARRAAPDRASRRRARHGVDRDARQRREDFLRRRRPRYTDRRVHDFLKREARKDLHKAAQVYAAGTRRAGQAGVDPRSVEPLGFLHLGRLVVVLLAADPGTALCAGLSRRARSGPSRRDEPFAAVLAGGRQVCDHVERAKTWLDTHGNDLHRYGIED